MSYQIVRDFPNDILFVQEGPFISLYQPTNRHLPENKQDIIVFKNLLKDTEASLARRYSLKEIAGIMEPLRQLAEDHVFWGDMLNGLAVLCNPAQCIVYKLNEAVEPLAIVADSFHIKPLIMAFQTVDRFMLLGLNGGEFDLFLGNQYGIEKVRLEPGTPRLIHEVLGNQVTESYLSQGSFNGAGRSSIYHGHGGSKEEEDKDTEKFFRYVDRFVLEEYSKPTKLPLILVALKEHHATFFEVSNNPYLFKEGIKGDYTSFTNDQLREKTWELIEPLYKARLEEYAQRFEQAKNDSRSSDSVVAICKAVVENRVATLLLEKDRIIPGKIDPQTGKFFARKLGDPKTDDALDDLAQLMLQNKGEIVIMPPDRMPTGTGVAAIFRY